jgi:putative ABC transport system ATP-binding protein
MSPSSVISYTAQWHELGHPPYWSSKPMQAPELSLHHDTPSAEGASAVFHAHDVSKIYTMGEVEVQALRSVTLDLYEGEFVVLLGPSGSGKSTLLNILGALDVPTRGEVYYRDHILTKADDAELTRFRREHVGFVFQFYNLIPSLTALENVAVVAELSDHPLSAQEALEMVGLIERVNHFPAQLSGGEQQRVAIARAVVKHPDVLLCDEPTGALDFKTGKLVLEVLERVNREMNTTTAVITHNAAIAQMADRVVRLRSGEIVEIQENTSKASPADLTW